MGKSTNCQAAMAQTHLERIFNLLLLSLQPWINPLIDAMTAPASKLNADHCPLCGRTNQCAMALERVTGVSASPCWCTWVKIGPELLSRVPEEARARACICQACAAPSSLQG